MNPSTVLRLSSAVENAIRPLNPILSDPTNWL